MRTNWYYLISFALLLVAGVLPAATYQNPVLFGDYSDPDVVRVADDYYLVSSSFQAVPGLPILHSRDLVNWTIVGHAAPRLPSPDFDRPQHGNGMWAPSLRHHAGFFWIYVGDPDRGIYMTRARDARGPWEPLTLVKEAKGWIDPCPLWDDDGSMYLVHAWAKSRAGFNSILTVNRLSADGRRVLDEGTTVFDGRERHPTIEGPKFYKRNGWYYIFAPAGGVKTGWQTVLRSKNVLGPYEDKIILEQGSTPINGPHQGAWVDSRDGKSWFLHFQDRGAYGRIVHLQPMKWVNEWPEVGLGGEPVLSYEKVVGERISPQATDEFNDAKLGLQWQWQGNPKPNWYALKNGRLRLSGAPPTPAAPLLKSAGEVAGAPPDLWSATNLLLQKLPAESFTATTLVDPGSMRAGEQAGLVVMGVEYATLHIEKRKTGLAITQGTEEKYTAVQPIQLRVAITPEAIARFSYSEDGNRFLPLGKAFVARPGRWIGAKVGLFGPAEFDWFRVAETQPAERASLVVAQDGSADYRTVQEAVDAIPGDNSVNRTILIRNGVYREKVLLNKPYVSLVGEDREKTRIEFAQLRRLWREKHPDDYGASVVNIGPDATDIVIANLSVVNDYGRKNGGENDHQFAIRSMPFSNRIAILNVNAIADGGDTVSLWNSETGMSYYADSYFEGHVDYLCPRGWAYVTNSRFFGHNHNASIWHDGSKNEDQKLVIRNSHFDGVPNFALGRNHRDAQFYLLDVRFSETMADKPIYAANAPDPRLWGPRYYYANAGGRFAWAADNLHTAKGAPREEDITPEWTFNNQWDPATLPAVLPFAAIPRPEHASKWIKPTGTTLRWTRGRNATKSRVHFGETNPPTFRAETIGTSFETGPLEPDKTYYWRVDSGAPPTPAAIVEGKLWSFKTDARSTRIALAGDSTMTEKSGYGKGFKSHVAQTAAVLNLARGGRSSKSFRNEGHWDELLKQKPTHVLIQFGHNDQPGKGLDRETDMASYKANLARYVDEARAISAQPILVTPLTRRNYSEDGRIRTDLEAYAETTRQVAAEKKAPLIDLHGKSIELLNSLGPAVSPALGPIKTDGTLDKTHLNDTGSALVGALMAQEVRRVVPELAPHIREAKTPAVNPPWSVRMADSEMKRTPDPMLLDSTNGRPRWEYTPGLVLKSILHVAQRTGDERYYKYVKAYYDGMINAEGEIAGGYKLEDYNIDRINPGKPLFDLYAKMKDEKYRKAIELLRKQMREHPRTKEGGFWHKKRYPWQMWLDGLYMGAPFLAQYAVTFNEPALLDDMVTQFVLMEKNARDAKTGLLFHGWDESRQQKWADKETGRSPEFWGRAMGWYAMGLVETLDFVPANHRRRGELVAILNRLAEAVVKVQDPKTGVWWQVIDKGGREGNYLESSVSAMLSFALQKAARLRIIDAKYGEAGRRAYQGILKEFIEVDKEGLTNIHKVCQVAGLGGDPEKGEKYRSGTFEYYISEPIRSNDPKGVGPFIFASQEYELR